MWRLFDFVIKPLIVLFVVAALVWFLLAMVGVGS
jgi:hypothetical protein